MIMKQLRWMMGEKIWKIAGEIEDEKEKENFFRKGNSKILKDGGKIL